MCQAAPLPIVFPLHLVCAIEYSGYPSHPAGPSPIKEISVKFMFRTKFYKHIASPTDLFNSFVLFSLCRSRDIPKRIIPFSFHNLCMHMHVQKMKIQRIDTWGMHAYKCAEDENSKD